MQVFFVAMPLQILVGLAVLFIALPVTVRWFIDSLEGKMMPFVGP
jgi:flagellar biosynthetic protein FliR